MCASSVPSSKRQKTSNLVVCPCQFCQGCLVSRYLRQKHAKIGQPSSVKNQTVICLDNLKQLPLKLDNSDQPELVPNVDLDQPEMRDSEHFEVPSNDIPTSYGLTIDLNQAEPELLDSEQSSKDSEVQANSRVFDYDHETTEYDDELDQEDDLTQHTCTSLNEIGEFDPSLYRSGIATTPLYDGSSVTLLQALADMFDWFTSHPGTSKESLSRVLHMQCHSLLPSWNIMPDNYKSALSLLEPYLLKTIVFHVCPKECVLFRGKLENATHCPVCGEARYKIRKLPRKTFHYMPLGPRLQRLYCTKNIAQILQCHKARTGNVMFDIQDSPAWKSAFGMDGVFGGDPRDVGLSLCTDGVNPFSHQRVTYSMWPIMLANLNLPSTIRNKFPNIMLAGIIPGNGRQEPKEISTYLEVIVDELLDLSLSNTKVYDAYREAPFTLKADLLLYVLDYPGINKVFGICGSGAYFGCAWCEIKGEYNKDLSKMIYLGNRRYLPHNNPLRQQTSFPHNLKESRAPPATRVWTESKQVHEAYDNTNRSEASAIARGTGTKSSYSLMHLPTHNPLTQTMPDAMHTVKNVIENILELMIGRRGSEKVKKAEKNIRFGINPVSQQFLLTKEQLKIADERMSEISTPLHVDYRPKLIFQKKQHFKSHDWKQLVCQGILKYCLRECLREQQRRSFFFFLDVISIILDECQDLQCLDSLEEQINIALALLERDFPVYIQNITTHLLHHIVRGIKEFGPVYSTWMFPYERFNSWLCQRVLNRAHPEATIMATYKIYDWCSYMHLSGRLEKTSLFNVREAVPLKQSLLSDSMFEQVVSIYLKTIPEYSSIVNEYECERKRSRSSTFPSKSDCKPCARELSVKDKMLLEGPRREIVVLKRLSMQNEKTKRVVTCTSSESEGTTFLSQVRSSFIVVVDPMYTANMTSKFGQIE